MARIRYSHNSFSVGILSKKIQGNTDFEGYNNSLDECVNFQVQSTSGLMKRGGTRFVAELKGNEYGHTGQARLILFAYSADAQYICEFGTNYIRFFTKKGQIVTENGEPYEVTTDLDFQEDIKGMKTFQDGNVLYLITSKGIYVLTRVSDLNFILYKARKYTYEPLTFMNIEPIGLVPELNESTRILTIRAFNPDDTESPPDKRYAPVFFADDVNHYLVFNYSTYDEELKLDVNMAFYLKILSVEVDPEAQGFNLVTAKVDAKRSYHNMDVLPNMDMVLDWQIGAFTDTRGIPKASAMFEGRLFLANNLSYPNGIWGSSKLYNDFLNFELGTNAADGVQYLMSGEHSDEILWLVAQSKLFVGTKWGIYIAGAATFNDEAISPANFRIRLFEAVGASELQPICALDAVFFVDASQKNVHEIVLSAETGAYEAHDLSLLANDLTQSGIIAHAWQQTPIKTYWCATLEGHLCALTYLKNNEILAWTKHEIAGNNVTVQDLCVMHGDDNDRVYMIVQRDVDGVFKKYIEYIHAPHDPLTEEQFKQFYVDSGVSKSLKYSIKNIEKGQNAGVRLRTSNIKELLKIYQQNDEALVVFRWNKPNISAPKIPFTSLNPFLIRGMKKEDEHYYFEIFGYISADIRKRFTSKIYFHKLDSDQFTTSDYDSKNFDIYVKVSNITKCGIGTNTVIYCDTQFLNDGDQILIMGTGLKFKEHSFDYENGGEIFSFNKTTDYIVLRTKNNKHYVPSDTFNLGDEASIYVKICECSSLFNSTPAKIQLTEKIQDVDLQELLLTKSVYINRVPGMRQINSRTFDFKRFSNAQDTTTLILYDPEASFSPRDFPVELDASHFSPYDLNYGGGDLYIYFTKMNGLKHLAGQEVAICADGNSRPNSVVEEDGTIDLGEVAAMYCSAGLPYKSVLKTVPFAGGSVLGSSVGCVGSQKSAFMYLYHSLGGKYGSEDGNTYALQYPEFPYKYKVRPLFTGQLKCPIMNSSDIYKRAIYIEHSEPLAFNILQITQDIEVSDA